MRIKYAKQFLPGVKQQGPKVTDKKDEKTQPEMKQTGGIVGMKTGGIIGKAMTKVKSQIPDMSVNNLTVKKQSSGVTESKMTGGDNKKSQEFRQNNMKQMSQEVKSGSPVVIVNNNSGGSALPPQSGGDPAKVPTLPNEPSNDVWKSYYNFARRISIG